MNKEQEGDKLITEFMELSARFSKPYHLSFDLLMSVVEKIESLGFDSNIHSYHGEGHYCTIKEGDFCRGYGESESKRKAVWLSVIEFINWYNKNK